MAIVEALADQMGMLEAEERLGAITDIAAATGSMRKGASSAHLRALRRARRQKPREATEDDLAALGFEVKHA